MPNVGHPVDYPEEKLIAYRIWANKPCGGQALYTQLKKAIDIGNLSLGAVKHWVRGFRESKVPEGVSHVDQEFRWEEMEQFDLPWDSAGYLLPLLAEVQWLQDWVHQLAVTRPDLKIEEFEEPISIKPPVRQVIWWWRVHLAAPDIGLDDVIALGAECYWREIANIAHRTPLYLDDITSFLAYRPWQDEQSRDRYRNALNLGTVLPRNSGLKTQDVEAIIDMTPDRQESLRRRFHMMPLRLDTLPHSTKAFSTDYSGWAALLPSEQKARLIENQGSQSANGTANGTSDDKHQ